MISIFLASYLLTSLLYPILGFVALPHAVNIDSWLLLVCKNDLSIYGKIRCTPFIMYAVTSVVLGRLIAAHGYFLMLVFGTFFLMTGIAAALMLPEGGKVAQDKEKQEVGRGSVKQVFYSESYRYLVVLLFLIGLAIAPMNHLKTAILENVGGSVSDLGIDGFISAITQVPFIACADKVEKLSLRVRYLFVTGLPCIACLLAYCTVSPVMIFAGSGLINSGIDPAANRPSGLLPTGELSSTMGTAIPQAGTTVVRSNASTGSGTYFTIAAAGACSSTGDSVLSRSRSMRTEPLTR